MKKLKWTCHFESRQSIEIYLRLLKKFLGNHIQGKAVFIGK